MLLPWETFEELGIEWAWLMRNSKLREPLKGVSTAPPNFQIRFENNLCQFVWNQTLHSVTSFAGTVY